MSVVTNYILVAPINQNEHDDGDDLLDKMNAFVKERLGYLSPRYGNGFKRVDVHAGGPKRVEADVFMLASNHLRASELAPFLRAFFVAHVIDISDPYGPQTKDFQLLVLDDGEDERVFTEYPLWEQGP